MQSNYSTWPCFRGKFFFYVRHEEHFSRYMVWSMMAAPAIMTTWLPLLNVFTAVNKSACSCAIQPPVKRIKALSFVEPQRQKECLRYRRLSRSLTVWELRSISCFLSSKPQMCICFIKSSISWGSENKKLISFSINYFCFAACEVKLCPLHCLLFLNDLAHHWDQWQKCVHRNNMKKICLKKT